MKKIFCLSFLIAVSGCASSFEIISDSNSVVSKANTAQTNKKTIAQEKDSTGKNGKKKRNYPMIFVGAISLTEGKADAFENQIWSLAESADRYVNGEPTFEIDENEIIEVDIMNCAGYLGSGKAAYDGGDGLNWKIKFIPESIAADAPDKLTQCAGNQNDDYVESGAFAVAPRNDKRKTIKIGAVDTKKLFASLAKDTQKWLKNKYASDVHKSGKLSLEEDNWTDLDGDGKIDLIFAFTNYDEEHSGGTIMLLVNGKWKDVGGVRD